jgi:hypothetical protein
MNRYDQIHEDENFARSLQEAEIGVHIPRSPPAVGNDGLNPINHGDNRQQMIRNNLAGQVHAIGSQSRKMFIFSLVYYACEALASTIVLSQYWGAPCDRPMQIWLLVSLLRLFVVVPFTIKNYLLRQRANDPYLEFRLHRIGQWIQILEFLWFVMGQSWLYSTSDCKETAPAVYYLSLIYVILMYLRVAFPIIMLVLICLCFPCLVMTLRNMQAVPGADHSRIERLPTRVFSVGVGQQASAAGESSVDLEAQGNDNQHNTCSICMEDYSDGDELRCLPCNHEYHKVCVDPWLGIHSTCPLCRRSILGPAV